MTATKVQLWCATKTCAAGLRFCKGNQPGMLAEHASLRNHLLPQHNCRVNNFTKSVNWTCLQAQTPW